MRARVVRGSRNVFTLRPESERPGEGRNEFECRIKGKILKGVEGYYNPLAPGDIVETEGGLITGLVKRKNTFARFNQKGQAPQLLAANVDLVACLTTAHSPPFRPRFIDRVLFQAEYSNIQAVLVCNKLDLGEEGPDTAGRLEGFKRIGYPVFRVSALSGEGMEQFRSFIAGKFLVLTGHSGVGKSSLIKALNPALEIKTGALNEKYKRGNHTTTQSALLDFPVNDESNMRSSIIDTPGIRRFAPERVPVSDVILYMREFAPLAGKCGFGLSCTHEAEPGCKIMEAVNAGAIHKDRYESFLRIRDEMAGVERYPDYD
ncbi:MAG: ribosome small subunit-dependent GTPase A [Treponema sp.]|jgi:ribosome biogenesis GTPase|nr:ribosome small subunit-dependent GTPase A [Treponema sp.]